MSELGDFFDLGDLNEIVPTITVDHWMETYALKDPQLKDHVPALLRQPYSPLNLAWRNEWVRWMNSMDGETVAQYPWQIDNTLVHWYCIGHCWLLAVGCWLLAVGCWRHCLKAEHR